jgi:hypothetical protein
MENDYGRKELVTKILRKLELRQLVQKLRQHPIVEHAKYKHNHIWIHYKTGTKEKWYHNPPLRPIRHLLPENPTEGPPLHIRRETEYFSLDNNAIDNERLFYINYKEWHKANFFDQRIIPQMLIAKLLNEGWLPTKYTTADLLRDWVAVTKIDPFLHHFCDGHIRLHGRLNHKHGRLIMEHFGEWAHVIKELWQERLRLNHGIWRLLKMKRNITRMSLSHIVAARAGHVILNPTLYRGIIKYFGLSGAKIADPSPGYGAKAMAAVMEGCQYHCATPLDGLAKLLGTTFYPLTPDEEYDVVFLDYHFKDHIDDPDLKADIKIVYIPENKQHEYPKPIKTIPIADMPWVPQGYLCYYA